MKHSQAFSGKRSCDWYFLGTQGIQSASALKPRKSFAISLSLTQRRSGHCHGSEALGSWTQPCLNQQYTFTQNFIHSPQYQPCHVQCDTVEEIGHWYMSTSQGELLSSSFCKFIVSSCNIETLQYPVNHTVKVLQSFFL